MGILNQIALTTWRIFEPPPELTVSEWAEKERYLSPESSAEPGKWSNDRAPHLVAPMDALSPSDPCQEVILKFSAQSGKTEVLNNFAGYIIDQDPGPALVVQPNTKPMGEAWSKDRLAPMIRDTPSLSGKVRDAKGRDSNNTVLHKTFPRGHITVGGANSPSGLASRPIRYLMCDEIDRYESTKEGDPKKLAQKRTTTFWNRKILKVSSPTLDDVGIDAEYNQADQQWEWQLRCNDCGEYQYPKFQHYTFSDNETSFACAHCGVSHSANEEHKIKLTGKWVCVKNEGDKKKAFMMNQWGSPFVTWQETIDEFRDAKGDRMKLQTVINTAFTETWKEEGDEIDPDPIYARREQYSHELPGGILLLTGSVDTQDDRLECEIQGWGTGEERWSVDRTVFYGDPGRDELWDRLDQHLQRTFEHATGSRLRISAVCIDTGGHYAHNAHKYCHDKRARGIYAIVGGKAKGGPIVPSKQSKMQKGRYKGFTLGVDTAKELIYGRLQVSSPGPGYCHFPIADWCDREYFAQLTAERRVTKYSKGFVVQGWVKTRPRNETLDLWVYGYAAMLILNPSWDALAARFKVVTEAKIKNEAPPKKRRKRILSSGVKL